MKNIAAVQGTGRAVGRVKRTRLKAGERTLFSFVSYILFSFGSAKLCEFLQRETKTRMELRLTLCGVQKAPKGVVRKCVSRVAVVFVARD